MELAITSAYSDLYQQHQNRDLQIKEVILFSDFGQKNLLSLPTVETIRALLSRSIVV
ncbi:hypothetical protein [Pseudanabaena sp. SR411]|uniref:hypothetical protein n=1 Tax=Pseudanabaena sp. SR411 TaxID=1980935 RepID=UPI00159502E7|nr:hypothetical protein [Pseudanabaena sp. SR411]